MFDVTLETNPPRHLIGMPHTGPYIEIGQTFGKVSAIITARDLWANSSGMVGVYYDDPSAVPEAELRSFAALSVPQDLITDPPLETLDLPGGPHAVLHFKGPYPRLKAAYDYLYGEWLPNSGKTPAHAAPYEIYLNSPMDTAPDDLLTDICVPLNAA